MIRFNFKDEAFQEANLISFLLSLLITALAALLSVASLRVVTPLAGKLPAVLVIAVIVLLALFLLFRLNRMVWHRALTPWRQELSESLIGLKHNLAQSTGFLEALPILVKEQSDRLREASEVVSKLVAGFHSHGSEAAELMKHLDAESDAIQEFELEVKELNAGNQALIADRRECINRLRGLAFRLNPLHEYAAALDKVAADAKLLAFNASIEAANAGAGGVKFEQVARSIRRVADQLGACTARLRNSLDDISKMGEELTSKANEESASEVGECPSKVAMFDRIDQMSGSVMATIGLSKGLAELFDLSSADLQQINNEFACIRGLAEKALAVDKEMTAVLNQATQKINDIESKL